MSLRARPYVAGDARLVAVQPEQTIEARAGLSDADQAAAAGPSYTILRDDRVIAVGGIVPVWRGYATAWAFAEPLDPRAGAFARRQIRKAIGELGFVRRVEATARCDFLRAFNFLTACGFRRATRLEAYGPDGADFWLFAWINAEARS